MKSEKIFSGERKVLAAGIAVVLLANAAGLTLYILEKRSGDRENTEYLERREFGQGDYEEKLTVKSEKGNQDITVQVREKEYGEEEAEEIIEQVKEEMDALIRGENKSLNKVQHPLYLPDRSPDFPVNLSWSTDTPEILDWEGKIGDNAAEGGTVVKLTCDLSLGEAEGRWEKEVTVYPELVSHKIKLEREIQRAVDAQNPASGDKVKLPKEVDGTKVIFRKEQSGNGLLISLFGTLLGLLILPLYRDKQKEKQRKKKTEMQADYPDIVS